MIKATTTVNVTGQVTRLAMSAAASTTAGNTVQLTVSAIDSTGAVATGYSTKVHFSSSDVQAGLPADYTFTPEDAGSHTFTVTLKTAGTQVLSVIEVVVPFADQHQFRFDLKSLRHWYWPVEQVRLAYRVQ